MNETTMLKRKIAIIGAGVGLALSIFGKNKDVFMTAGYIVFFYGIGNVIGDVATYSKDKQALQIQK